MACLGEGRGAPPEDGSLHGKAIIVVSHEEGVTAGSSNFTCAGLATNVELNLGQYQPVHQVLEWFDEPRERTTTYDLATLYAERFAVHAPQLVYLRMLLLADALRALRRRDRRRGGS